ncbi:MAG: bifunctional 5,10-methylene-tetrahydrofolate dehydrogenase/5,10-methylene-tetrahydrofolate cyclohydrolase [Chitinispirillales bacterium]|jgi:methylenetetrahydrofolate dehydrogenase (NADP+)/methenyltetrahydrofolate cyclohydrolase|nr:bifunctional 5,10-methylene-tetrahydrofolate dehydrogenase/5,10-methylene-tetrahydrofolate cyclohydrolase [Chitinispirillales bacterium]
MSQPIVLDGKMLAAKIEDELKSRICELKNKNGNAPLILATILVGNDPASATYVKMKGNACLRIGLEPMKIELPHDTSTKKLLEKIEDLNQNKNVFGILLQHPVPSQINERAAFDKILLKKDVDGVTSLGFGKMAMGETVFGSATPSGIMRLIDYYGINCAGKNALVVGRSAILGKPAAMMLLNKNATVTVCHSQTKNLDKMIKDAEIVVGAVGKPKFIKGEWIADNAVIIDAGYHPQQKCGDIDLENCKDRSFAYTPVPGGVGPMTIASLMEQTTISAEKSLGN